MIRILDKGILFGLGAVLLFQRQEFVIPVVVLLTALIFSSFSLYLTDAKILGILWMGYLVLCVIRPEFSYFLPLLLYDSMWYSFYWGLAGVLFYYPAREIYTGWMSMLWLLTAFLAVYMAYKSEKNDRLDADIIHLRDTDTELKLVMEQRNRELLEKQDNEIYLATLRERNRIAREIHDNVGHMLSRSILQVGALATICKEETIRQQLAGINDTLNQAMNSIRESVHDLHDDAIDLRQAAYEAVKDTPEFQSLQTKEERLHYLEEAAAKQAGAPDIETAATNGYVNLGGEKMARQTAKRWYYTKDQREKTWPDVAGNVLDKSVESQRIVETLERIGYTEDEIEAFIKNWGGQK